MLKLSIVSPCYNEEDILPSSVSRLDVLLRSLIEKQLISKDSFVLFVNDGSKDKTWNIIKKSHSDNNFVKGINLAHNVGHQNAIMAGMMVAKDISDAVITIDVDLQDDINAIEKMINAYNEGYDVVYGVKVSRQADPLLKRLSASVFYKLQNYLGVESVYNHADFRLMSKRALVMLAGYGERNLYLRGLIPLLGLPSTTVDDTLNDRIAGKSKYTLKKMINLAVDGITSFSVRPIYLILDMGIVFMCISLIIGMDIIYSMVTGSAVPGWASLMISLWFVGGCCLLAMGTIGIYMGKIYTEVKNRPLYNIQDFLD